MANKETRIFTTDTLETLRQKTNDIALNLGDNEQFNASLSDKTFNYNNVSAGDTLFTGLDVLNKTLEFNIKTEQTLDNTGGYIILTGSPSITGFVADAILTQAGGYSATIVSASTDKILVKNSSGTFSSSENLVVGGDSIAASAVVRIIGEAFHIGVVRVYVNNTEISQNLLSGGFHVANYSANIPLLNSPTVTAFTEGSTVYQGTNLASATFSGTVLSASATDLKLKNHTGSFSASAVIKIDGSSSTITGANHQDISNKDTTIGNAIVLNTPATLNDDIKVYSPSLVDAVNELQDDVGITENLTTVSGNLVGAVNEIEAVFDASTHEISAGSTAFNVTSGEFTIDSSADIVLDADGGNVELKDAGTQYGSLTNSSGNIVVKSGSTTMLTGNGADATFANNVTVTQDVDVDRNLNVDGTTELNSTLGVDGNFRVGSSNTSKFDVAAATGNTQIDGTLEVDGTAGIDGDLRVGTDKFNVTAASGNTQIDGTLEVDGTAGVDGNFRVGSSGGDKFNVTAASGNTQIDGTLNVDSTTTLNGTTIDGNLDLNGSVDVSTNATIHGVLDVDGVSNLDVVDIDGAVDMASTLQVDGNTTIDGVLDIGQLNTLFTNRNDVKLALDELHTEVGSAQIGLVSGLAAYGQSNMTNAINIIDAEIGAVADYAGGTYGSTTISGVLTNLQTGMISNDTDITNLFADVGSLALVDNLPADYTYTVTDLTTATNTMSGFIGNTSIADIGTTDTVTGALQKLHAEIGDSVLTVFSEPNRNISGALRELEAEKVYLTSSSQQEIASKLGLTGNVTFKDGGSNANKMTFNSGTTLDLSNASLLLPGNSSNVNIFSASFLEVDGNVQIQGFSVDRDHVTTLTDKTDVRLQWNENHADGTSTTKPARSWQFVGLDDAAASHTTDIVTFYNAKELITNNTESGINVTWDASSETFDFNVNDPTVQLSGDVVGSAVMTNLGSINISTTIQPNSVALGTDTTGNYIKTLTGTQYQVTVSPASHSEGKDATLSIPSDFRIPGTAKVLSTTGASSATTGALTVAGGVGIGEDLYIAGNLYVEGTRTELNVTTLEVEDTLILAGNNLVSEPSSGGFGIETGPITSPSGVASNVTGAHSIVYNYGTDRWEADGSLILSEATLGAPTIEGNTFGASNNLDFSAGTGISVTTTTSGNDIDVVITNTLDGYSGWFLSTQGTDRGNIADDERVDFHGGTAITATYDTTNNNRVIFDHDNVGPGAQTFGQPGTEDGTYLKSVTINAQGHITGVTTDDFDDRYNNFTYTHPVFGGDDISIDTGPLSGATVISDLDFHVTTNTQGHVTDAAVTTVATRELTLADLGYTGATNANNFTYTHPSDGGGSIPTGAALTGQTVIDEITVNSLGHVTGTSTRELTLADLGYTGATNANNSTNNVTTNISITQTSNTDTVTVNSSDGTDGTIAAASSSNGSNGNAGIMTRAMVHKLNGIAVGATATSQPYYTSAIGVGDGGLTQKNFTTTLKTKLDGIAVGATATSQPYYTSAIPNATASTTGLMTSTYAAKLDGIAAGATNTVGNATHTGEVTGSHALTIASNVVSNAKLADMAASTIKGRITSNGDPQDLSAAQVRTMLSLANSATTSHSSANTGGLIVSRDGSGHFSAGIITASLNGTASNATAAGQLYINSNDGYNAACYIAGFPAGNTSGNKYAQTDSGIYFNPALNRLYAGNITADLASCTGYAYSNLTGKPTIGNTYSNNMNQYVRTSDTVQFGLIRSTGDIVAYYSSDERLKDNVQVIDGALEKVSKLRGVEFDWNDKQDVYEGHDIGVIAQDVEAVAPELVQTREDGFKAVKYEKLTALLIEAVKELREENKSIRAELEILKSINT